MRTVGRDPENTVKFFAVTDPRLYSPVCWIVLQFSRVACANMGSGNLILGQFQFHQFIHVFLDDHVAVQEDNALNPYLMS